MDVPRTLPDVEKRILSPPLEVMMAAAEMVMLTAVIAAVVPENSQLRPAEDAMAELV